MRKIIIRLITLLSFLILLVITRGVFFIVPAFAEKSSAERYQEASQYANSLRGTVSTKIKEFKPGEVFKDQKGGYTENPSQTNHYQGITQSDTNSMDRASRIEVTKDEDYKDADGRTISAPGKAITEDFRSRPIYKISKTDEHIKKGSIITSNAQNVVTGKSNKYINCEKGKMSTCKTVYYEATCNEEVRTVRRICDKVPRFTMSTRDDIYPSCRNMVVTQDVHVSCPPGYSQIYYSDMIKGVTWDDIRLCVKSMPDNAPCECYVGHLVVGVYGNSHTRLINSTERAVVPKKRHGRVRFSSVYRDPMEVTIINETTGEKLYNGGRFTSGQVISLPYSEVQDQTFKFRVGKELTDAERRNDRMFYGHGRGGGNPWNSYAGGIGVMVLTVDHINREPTAEVTSWEESCHDI